MFSEFIEKLKQDTSNLNQFQELFVEKEIPAKTILLHAGETAHSMYFIKKGCVRLWFNKDGKDITLQFFFDGQPVASIDSFLYKQPSLFTIESIEPTVIISISRDNFEILNQKYPLCKDTFHDYLFERFRNYAQLFLSRIKDSPRERYEDLVKNNPEIIKRVPLLYIASYLGITPISLSRIRNRKQ